jgi:hypothetical protein
MGPMILSNEYFFRVSFPKIESHGVKLKMIFVTYSFLGSGY